MTESRFYQNLECRTTEINSLSWIFFGWSRIWRRRRRLSKIFAAGGRPAYTAAYKSAA